MRDRYFILRGLPLALLVIALAIPVSTGASSSARVASGVPPLPPQNPIPPNNVTGISVATAFTWTSSGVDYTPKVVLLK
jgi:hypothetical protein